MSITARNAIVSVHSNIAKDAVVIRVRVNGHSSVNRRVKGKNTNKEVLRKKKWFRQ